MWDKLIKWSGEQFNHLPWRRQRSLYSTLVSEIMLQQTTVSTVTQHFTRFMNEYPDLLSLARASEEQVLISWKGLGYYRRAKNLLRLAQEMGEKYQGEIPRQREKLLAIKGIGDYTANAILSIGLDQPVFAVDANLQRVLSRLFALEDIAGPKLRASIEKLLENRELKAELVRIGGRAVNEALMDLGRTICRAQKAACEICPMAAHCLAFRTNKVETLPVLAKGNKGSEKREKFELSLLRVLVFKQGKILAYKKNDGEWLSGQWELPTFILDSNDASLKQYPRLKKGMRKGALTYKTTITKYTITNYLHELSEKEFKLLQAAGREYKFCHPQKAQSNLSTASLKAIKLHEKNQQEHS